jgi:phosphoesterase RecJ-like protein
MFEEIEKDGNVIYHPRKIVAEALAEADSIVIASHEGPEPDAIGSSLALGLALEMLGKKVFIYNKDYLESAKFLPGYEKIKNHLPDFLPDIFCVVDCATLDRIGEEAKNFAVRTTIVNIDHHSKGENFGTFNYVDPSAPACGVLIYEVLKELKVKITPDIATNIYAAIAKDTMGFILPVVDSRSLKIAAELVESGANLEAVMKTLKYATLRKYKLLSFFLSRLKVEDSISSSYLLLEDFEKASAKDEDSDEFIDLIRGIDGVVASIFVREKYPGIFKVSMRSQGEIDVAEIARKYGGGGHKNAAGFNLKVQDWKELSKLQDKNKIAEEILNITKNEILQYIKGEKKREEAK